VVRLFIGVGFQQVAHDSQVLEGRDTFEAIESRAAGDEKVERGDFEALGLVGVDARIRVIENMAL
jgi:hypothetical protein